MALLGVYLVRKFESGMDGDWSSSVTDIACWTRVKSRSPSPVGSPERILHTTGQEQPPGKQSICLRTPGRLPGRRDDKFLFRHQADPWPGRFKEGNHGWPPPTESH